MKEVLQPPGLTSPGWPSTLRIGAQPLERRGSIYMADNQEPRPGIGTPPAPNQPNRPDRGGSPPTARPPNGETRPNGPQPARPRQEIVVPPLPTDTDPKLQNVIREIESELRQSGRPLQGLDPSFLKSQIERVRKLVDENPFGPIPQEGSRILETLRAASRAQAQAIAEEQARGRGERRGYYMNLQDEDIQMLERDPLAWLDQQFDFLYEVASHGQELDSPLAEQIERAIGDAARFVQNQYITTRDEKIRVQLQQFNEEHTVRFNLMYMRGAMAFRALENVQRASQRLQSHGLLSALRFQNGAVLAMYNRMDELFEHERLKLPNKHVLPETVYKLQTQIEEEQLRFARAGVGDFAQHFKTGLADAEAERRARRDVVRAVRIAYDVFVTSQREAVIAARGKAIAAPLGFYTDPRSLLDIYNLEHLLIEKFGIFNAEDEELVRRIKLEMADDHLRDAGYDVRKFSDAYKEDLGKRLFRDLFVVPDFYSSSWRIRGMLETVKNRLQLVYRENGYTISQADLDREAGKFGLFLQLKAAGGHSDAERVASRRPVWEKIVTYRPEEILRLFRERAPEDRDFQNLMLRNPAFQDLTNRFSDSDRTKYDQLSTDKDRAEFVYDRFKELYGPALRMLRDQALRGTANNPIPEQLDMTDLNEEQQNTINTVMGDEQAAVRVRDMYQAMKNFIAGDIDAKHLQEFGTFATKIKDFKDRRDTAIDRHDIRGAHHIDEEKKAFLKDFLAYEDAKMQDKIHLLVRDPRFADIYARTLLVDDVLLDRAELDKDKAGNRTVTPLSRLWSSERGGDGLVRTWNDTAAAVTAGKELIGFIKSEDLKEKEKHAVAFGESTSGYNGQEGRAKTIRYTLGTYLNLSKIDGLMDAMGIRQFPFRIPMSELEKIYGPQAPDLSRDELRQQLDHLRLLLVNTAETPREEEKNLSNSEREKLRQHRTHEAEKFYQDLEALFEVTAGHTIRRRLITLLVFMIVAMLIEAKHIIDPENLLTGGGKK